MKKRNFINKCGIFIVCCLCLFFSCSDNNDDDKKEETTEDPNQPGTYGAGTLTLSFDFTNDGRASSQYAIWIEDASGNYVKTVFVTEFTAIRQFAEGLNRYQSLPTWVGIYDPKNNQNGIDAISGATPSSGSQTYTWDATDDSGKKVPNGTYTFYIEGTCYWVNRVDYSGQVTIGGGSQSSIPVTLERHEDPNYHDPELDDDSNLPRNRDMIINVKAKYKAK